MSKRDPAQMLPLTSAIFQILLALAGSELHGYAIMNEVRQRSGGSVRLGPGTLYGSIKKMLAEGLIQEAERPDPELDDERRRYYRLTQFGREVAAAEASRLADLVSDARAKKLLPADTG